MILSGIKFRGTNLNTYANGVYKILLSRTTRVRLNIKLLRTSSRLPSRRESLKLTGPSKVAKDEFAGF